MREQVEYEAALRLIGDGAGDGQVSARLGIPRRTVNGWRRVPRRRIAVFADPDWRPPDPLLYSYLLGLYLGDGHIACRDRAPFLRICLDSAYPDIVAKARSAVAASFPLSNVLVLAYRPEVRIVQVSDPSLVIAFPQRGAGPKHLRTIELLGWQRDVTAQHPEALLRGLIHSDGSRCINRFATKLPGGRVARYAYPRYFFTNLSADIRGIFCEHCELLGIRWTQSNSRNISVSHRDSVAILDSFVGPKR